MSSDSLTELMAKVHKLELKAKKLSANTFAGMYHSSFKGQGLDFEDFREYHHGDEPRFIDWNVTARMNAPFIRTFKEARELSIIIAVDISGSSIFGSKHMSKRELAAELTALIAFAAKHNGDKVGLLLFAGQTELFLPAEKSSKHILRVIREVLATEPKKPETEISKACNFLNKTLPKRCLVFLLSDFIDYSFEKRIGALSKRHDLVAIRISDPSEFDIPDVGKIILTDPETGEQINVNTADKKIRERYKQLVENHMKATSKVFYKYGIDHCDVNTIDDYTKSLYKMLKNRSFQHA